MNAIYDIVCSVFVGGIILVMLVGFNGNISENAVAATVRMTAQTNMTALENMMEYEFRKIGYRVDALPADSGISSASRTSLTVKGDFNNDGTVDILRYYIDTTTATGLPNTNTRFIYRVMNGSSRTLNLGATKCAFAYFDKYGFPITADPVPAPSRIYAVRVSMTVETTVPWKGSYEKKYMKFNPGVYWERTFRPANLR